MLEIAPILENRLLTSKEIGAVVTLVRDTRGWTQETLAEIAGVTVRTVQRVERGEPSSTDTRRALARALEWDDLDAFNKPWPMPNYEQMKERHERVLRDTIAVDVTPILTGRQLRELADFAEGWQHNQLSELPAAASEAFATLQDYFIDYGDINECYSASEKLGVDQDFQALIDTMKADAIGLCAGTRRVRFGNSTDNDVLRATVVHVVAAPVDQLPRAIRVPRQASMSL